MEKKDTLITLTEAVQELNEDVGTLAKRYRRQLFYMITVAVGVVCTLILFVFVLNLYQRLQDTIVRQDEIRREVSCPLHKLLLSSDTPERRAATPPDQRKFLEDAFNTLRHSYTIVLRCEDM